VQEAFLRRIPSFRMLDALRGFAALWVVMDHACAPFLAANDPRYVHQLLYAFSIRGQLGVLFFFIISGYCIAAAAYGALIGNKPLWRYGYERVRRIYPPYLAVLLLGIVSNAAIGFASAHRWIEPVHHLMVFYPSPRYWIANLFLIQSELHTGMVLAVFWSLCAEVAFYAIVGILLWIAQQVAARRGPASGTLALILGLALTIYASLLSLIVFDNALFPFDLWHQFALGGLLFFLIESKPGFVAGYSIRLRRIINSAAALAAVLTLIFIALRPGIEVDVAHPASRIRSITCLLFCVLLTGLRRIDERLAASRWMRPWLWLGASSYSLYLIHPIVLPFADILCRKAGLDGDRYWLTFWIQCAAAIAAGRLFYYLVERHCISSRQKRRLAEELAANS
jgi:peptidoglycan/LPS O-acetylase OafA/YrhL